MKTIKTLVATTVAFTYCIGAYSQGTVDFDTRAVNARAMFVVTGDPADPRPVTGNNPVSNLPFYTQLYAAAGPNALESTLQGVGTRISFRGGGNVLSPSAGYAQDLEPVVVTPIGGGAATVQQRAWTGGETYEQAAASFLIGTPGSGIGKSSPINFEFTGNPNGTPPTTQVPLTGLQGFTMTVTGIPEPSTYAMVAVGLIGLGISRWRKQGK
jgi:hypothetical protein